MQVHCKHPVGARDGDEVGAQLGGDRLARLDLAVLPRVAVVGNDRRDPPGRRALEGVDHDEQLHQVVVDRPAGRLHDEHVGAAHRLADVHRDLPVGKVPDLALAERQPEVAGDLRRNPGSRVCSKNFDVLPVKIHAAFPLPVMPFIFCPP